jgi:hypothetical protein
MKKTTLAIAAIALGAGAVYFLDPRLGPQRRRTVAERARGWLQDLEQGASGPMQSLRDWAGGLQQRWQERDQVVRDDESLAPLSMAPPALDAERTRRSRVLPALAVATPVAVAVGAALLRDRDEEGRWLH